MAEPRTFPVLLETWRAPPPGSTWTRRSVPWSFLAPHEAQAQRNHSQSLERLASRGGLSPAEMLCVVKDQEWQWWAIEYALIPHSTIEAELAKLLAKHEAQGEGTKSCMGCVPGGGGNDHLADCEALMDEEDLKTMDRIADLVGAARARRRCRAWPECDHEACRGPA